MSDAQQVWLTQDGYERLKDELRRLIRERSGETPADGRPAAREGTDEDMLVARREREQRIRKLQLMLQDPIVGEAPPDDGIAEPGMVVTVAFADSGDVERFLLAEREQESDPDIEVCSPGSPLGRALLGAREGERRQYLLPDGRPMTVTVERAVPYDSRVGR